MSLRHLTPAIRARMVDRFNARHQVGDWLLVWPGVMGDGPGELVQVREPGARVLGDHTPVVFVTGGHGCIDLLHVRRALRPTQRYSKDEAALVAQLAAEGLSCGAIARRLNEGGLARKRTAIGVCSCLKGIAARALGATARSGGAGAAA